MNKKIYFLAVLTTILAVGITTTQTNIGLQSTYAQVFDDGASALAPKAIPEIVVHLHTDERPGWDPNDAPGQQAESPHCIGCAKDFAPGTEGLDLGIIGSPKTVVP